MTDPVTFFVRLAGIAGQLESLLRAVVFLIGLLLVVHALRLSVRRSEQGPQTVPGAKALTSFIIGTGFLAFPQTVGILLGTIFGSVRPDDASGIFAYGGDLLSLVGGSRRAVEAVVLFIQLIGFIAVARGLLFLNCAATPGGPKSLGPGVTFIVAGALAVNFPSFFGVMANLFTAS